MSAGRGLDRLSSASSEDPAEVPPCFGGRSSGSVLLLTPDLERRQADIWSGKIAADLSVFESESSKLRPTR